MTLLMLATTTLLTETHHIADDSVLVSNFRCFLAHAQMFLAVRRRMSIVSQEIVSETMHNEYFREKIWRAIRVLWCSTKDRKTIQYSWLRTGHRMTLKTGIEQGLIFTSGFWYTFISVCYASTITKKPVFHDHQFRSPHLNNRNGNSIFVGNVNCFVRSSVTYIILSYEMFTVCGLHRLNFNSIN